MISLTQSRVLAKVKRVARTIALLWSLIDVMVQTRPEVLQAVASISLIALRLVTAGREQDPLLWVSAHVTINPMWTWSAVRVAETRLQVSR